MYKYTEVKFYLYFKWCIGLLNGAGSLETGETNGMVTVSVTPASPSHTSSNSHSVECKTGPYILAAEIIETGKLRQCSTNNDFTKSESLGSSCSIQS